MKIVRNNILPLGKDYVAINLFGILFLKRGVNLSPSLLNHETIHSHQIRELGYILFYIIYVLEWILRLIASRGDRYKAYRNISFEKEAYDNEEDSGYLEKRRPFSQWRRSVTRK